MNPKELQRVIDERDIMLLAKDAGIVSLHAAFQTVYT